MGARHRTFWVALLTGIVAGIGALALPLGDAARALVAADMFFAVYLVGIIGQAHKATPDDLRRHAAERDEGLPFILVLALGAVLISLTAILLVLQKPAGLVEGTLALAAVPLGWAMVQMVMAMHYAHAFYAPGDQKRLAFPGTDAPGLWDFLYFAFGIGMTAQVSDVTVRTGLLRRWVLGHAVGSFFYNTVILALAVNAGVALAG